MKKHLLLLLLCGCMRTQVYDYPVKLASINLIDQDGLSVTVTRPERLEEYDAVDFCAPQTYQKILRVYERDTSGNIKAVITSYHPNGGVKQYLDVVNNRASGSYQEWYPNGQIKIEGTVIGGMSDLTQEAQNGYLFDGLCKVWNEDGALQAEISYVKGLLDGASTYYHSNGLIWKSAVFSNDQLEGDYRLYTSNGELLKVESYVKGKKHGSAVRFWCDEKIASDETYCEGLCLQGKYFDQQGNLISEVKEGFGKRAVFSKNQVAELQTVQDGVVEGEIVCFSNEGLIQNRYHVKNGFKDGEEVEYWTKKRLKDETPRPKISVQWYQGALQGIVKTWYDNQVQESQKEMSKNVKSGHLTAWYRDGSLMLIEEYENDKLLKGEYYRKGEAVPVSEVRFGKGISTLYDGEGNFIKKVEYFNFKPVG